MDIFKMSNFEKLEESFGKKFILLGHRAKYKKNNSNIVSIKFFSFKIAEKFREKSISIFYGEIPKIPKKNPRKF